MRVTLAEKQRIVASFGRPAMLLTEPKRVPGPLDTATLRMWRPLSGESPPTVCLGFVVEVSEDGIAWMDCGMGGELPSGGVMTRTGGIRSSLVRGRCRFEVTSGRWGEPVAADFDLYLHGEPPEK